MKARYFLLLPLLCLAGCEPYRPPANAKLIQERTALGTTQTKVEARPQPYPVKAGNVSIWDLKVFDIKDKSSGLRTEWKTFAQLPQQPNATVSNTMVLMNAWIISRDGTIFLPQKPTAKGYGSFVTDWTIPRPGPYQLWVQYQPTIATEEGLTLSQLASRKASQTLKMETAHWPFVAGGELLASAPPSAPNAPAATPQAIPIYDAKGALIADTVKFGTIPIRAGQEVILKWSASGAPIETPEIVALAPDGKTLAHGIGTQAAMSFGVPGTWKIWLYFARDGQSFAAPDSLTVAP